MSNGKPLGRSSDEWEKVINDGRSDGCHRGPSCGLGCSPTELLPRPRVMDLTNDLSNLAYFFISALPKDKAIECLSQRKTLAENTVKSLRKRLAEFEGKTSVNRLFVIEKDLDRFKSELSRLKKLIKSAENAPV